MSAPTKRKSIDDRAPSPQSKKRPLLAMAPPTRAQSPDFYYLLLDPDYQPVDIGTFALGDLLHLTVPFVKVHLSENHNVSVQSMYIVDKDHQFDVKPLAYFKNLKLDWRQFLKSKGEPFGRRHFDEDRGEKVWILVTTKTDRIRPADQAVTPEPDVILKSPQPFLQAIRTRKYEPPSTGARDSVQRKKQNVDNPVAFFNGRPASLTGPPLGLYHPIFPKFKRLATEMEAVKLTANDLQFANELICESTQFYAHEDDHRTALRAVLGKLLGFDLPEDEWYGANDRLLRPDGACHAVNSSLGKLCFLYWEGKREIGEGHCDPIDQASEDYALTVALRKYDELRERSCMPAFLIATIGPYIAIGGAVFLDRPIVDLLTPMIPLRYQTTHAKQCASVSAADDQIREIARTLRALSICADELCDEYKNLDPKSHLNLSSVPWPHLTKIGDYTIEYQERLVPTPSRSVFRAIASRNDKTIEVIVKFTSRYCREAHDLVEESGAAPKLWHCGWDSTVGQTVVMYSYVSLEFDGGSPRLEREETIKLLSNAVRAMHGAGYVHGDLRMPNILLDGNNRPMVIDFDWAGRFDDPSTVYPGDIYPHSCFHPEVRAGVVILPKHDDHLFQLWRRSM